MPLDDTEKKLLPMLDSDFPGERGNALELLHEHQKKVGHFCRDIVREVDNTVSQQQYQDLENRCAAFAQANAGLAQQNNALARRLAAYKAALAVKLHWQRAVLIAVLPFGAWFAHHLWWGEPKAQREAAQPIFERMASNTTWVAASQDTAPIVRQVAGEPYWVIARFQQDQKHRDASGQPVTVQCVRLYAAPAAPDAGVYLKPRPYSLYGWGWLKWPERAADCRTDTVRSAKR